MSFRNGRGVSLRLAVIGPLVLAMLGLAPSVVGLSAYSMTHGVVAPEAPAADPAPAAVSAPVASTTDAASSTESAMRLRLFGRLNALRTAAGLVPLRSDAILQSVAEARAGRMAGAGILSHAVAGGDIGAALSATGLRWYGVAEDIGYSTSMWGSASVDWILQAWENSAEHRSIMLDDGMNYVGIGLGESASGAMYASLVFAETADRTAPIGRMTGAHLDGRTATFTWTGHDVQLQTRTAGLASFDVAYRVDGGSWRIVRSATAATAMVLRNRVAGHAYSVRVRARDRAGNLSTWSRALRLVVR